ncbi:MAG: YbaK/EbsC family protein [Acidobacteriota bacterium]|nr:YbaK/EbsC family protein [Acidobacteriota bacterium]
MPDIGRWLQYFDKRHIRYSHSTHTRTSTARGTADSERVPAHELAKTVVYFGSSGFGIVVVPADKMVDLPKVGRLMGLSHIRLATEKELEGLFPDCEIGAMPPFGENCEMPVLVDAGIVGEFIAFTLGTHRDVIRLSFADFQRLARPKIAAITEDRFVHA